MTQQSGVRACNACKDGVEQPFPFSMAFQPIVNVLDGSAFAYEALARGPEGQSAAWVLGQVHKANRYAFDQHCRVKAITLAARLGLASQGARLCINFIPGAVYSPVACIQLTLKTAQLVGFPCERLIFEITEDEQVRDRMHLQSIAEEYKRHGFQMAIDDFGAGYSGLNLLADFVPDILKLDMELTRNIDQRPRAQAIVKAISELSKTMGLCLIAEGIETLQEYSALRECGITLMQGYLFAKPQYECLPSFAMPDEKQFTPQRLAMGVNGMQPGVQLLPCSTPGAVIPARPRS